MIENLRFRTRVQAAASAVGDLPRTQSILGMALSIARTPRSGRLAVEILHTSQTFGAQGLQAKNVASDSE